MSDGAHTLWTSSSLLVWREQSLRQIYALHWCIRVAGINAFGQLWTRENGWINCPYNLIGKVWRTLREQNGLATTMIPLLKSAPGWQLICPDTNHVADNVVDWMWLPRDDPSLFVAGIAPGRAVLPPDWPVMAVRVDFTESRSSSARGSVASGGAPRLRHPLLASPVVKLGSRDRTCSPLTRVTRWRSHYLWACASPRPPMW